MSAPRTPATGSATGGHARSAPAGHARSWKDQQVRFHEEWLGLAQPIEGLVFSVPVLADAQVRPDSDPELAARFRAWLTGEEPSLPDLAAFFEQFLGFSQEGMLVRRAQLPEDLAFRAEEGRQEILPSFALARGPFEVEAATAADEALFGSFGAEPEQESDPDAEVDDAGEEAEEDDGAEATDDETEESDDEQGSDE